MSWEVIGPFLAALVIAGAHISLPWLQNRLGDRDAQFVSFVGGVAIGYVFLFLLPKIGDYTAAIVRREADDWEVLHYRLYIIALVGMLAYYLSDQLNVRKDARRHVGIVVHVTMFALYNFSIGNLFVQVQREGHMPYIFIGIVLAMHMLGVDNHLRHLYRERFDKWVRWIFAAAVMGGWVTGMFYTLSTATLAVLSAFVAGAILMTVMTEELPERNTRRTWFFVGGICLFTVMMMIVRSLDKI